MADDIVQRLHRADDCLSFLVCAKCERYVHSDSACNCACHGYPWTQAADDIERLRHELDDARATIRKLFAHDDGSLAAPLLEAVKQLVDLRTAGDSLAAATRTLVDTYMTEQSALYGHIAIDPDVLRALAEWGDVRG
jgi:hypothetical protein